MGLEKFDTLSSRVQRLIEAIKKLKEEKRLLENQLQAVSKNLAQSEQGRERLKQERNLVKSKIEKILGELDGMLSNHTGEKR
jgi:chromosome segregation ATPase